MDIYPDNTLSNFTVDLPQPLDLSGDWVVALSEIQYPHTWNNVRTLRNTFYTRRDDGIMVDRFSIPPGYYKTVKQLLSAMTKKLASKDLVLSYDEITRHVKVQVKGDHHLLIGDPLSSILGFDHDQPITRTTISPHVANLAGGFHSLYIYSDVVDAQVVGDSMVPLLRIINIEGADGQTMTKTFQNPYYMPVSRKFIERIQCNIKDDINQLVPFESGKLIVTLHFKRSKPFYL